MHTPIAIFVGTQKNGKYVPLGETVVISERTYNLNKKLLDQWGWTIGDEAIPLQAKGCTFDTDIDLDTPIEDIFVKVRRLRDNLTITQPLAFFDPPESQEVRKKKLTTSKSLRFRG